MLIGQTTRLVCHLYRRQVSRVRSSSLNQKLFQFLTNSLKRIPTSSSLTESDSIANGYGNSESPKTTTYHSKLPLTFTTPLRSSLGIIIVRTALKAGVYMQELEAKGAQWLHTS
ncbi:hypothetical protein KFK09_008702 [Dendrobium nobile]|uniref:Uncharacterized protein n=1 Tax=Dendrobium nobile TaxID=94219 RepID=A0A8T3BQN2_DENNO|nr:hypothetical protein KFK09_008702 [Dendrobium nobile]